MEQPSPPGDAASAAPKLASDATSATVKQRYERANAEQAAGRLSEAERLCREIIALDDRHFGAWHLLAIVAMRSGDPAAALSTVERAVALAPGRADCRNSHGFVLRALGRDDEAETAIREAVRLDPEFAEAHYQLGHLARETGRLAEAETSYRRVLALRPGHRLVSLCLGVVLGELKRFDEAAELLRRAVELAPDHAEAHAYLGLALRAIGRPEAAEAACRRALALAPRLPLGHLNLGVALQDLGRLDEAAAAFREAATLSSGRMLAMASLGEGILELLRGHFAAGFAKYEGRWQIGDLPPRGFAQPQWRGETLDGRTILLHAEQGLGDTIQFLRYAPLVARRGGKVVLEIQKPLASLAAQLSDVQVVARGDPLPAFDLHCPLLSLPLAFGTMPESVPCDGAYLSPDGARLAHWRERLGRGPELRIGIAWAGSPVHRNDRNRSIPLGRLAPLVTVAGAAFFSLQVGPRAADLAAIEPLRVTDLAPELSDFAETAAVIAALDLVIAADTAVAHLAGALGKPVWTLLPFAPDWRWLLGRADTPWYRSMRLFRQSRPGDWEGVAEAVRRALAERVAGAPLIPDTDRRTEYTALVRAANTHHLAKRHAECEAALRRALDIDPSNASAWHVLALTRHELDDKAEAVELMQKALALAPNSAVYHRDHSIVLHGVGRFTEAVAAAERSLMLDPEQAATHNELGAALAKLDRPPEAIAAYRRALELQPTYHEAWTNLGQAQQAVLALDDAADSYRRALGIKHDYPQAQCSSAMLSLLRGDYANGFTQFEWRRRLKVMTARDFKEPAWQGEALNGKTILLHEEQGLGDTLQCLRFVPEVAARGGRLLLELPAPLTRLATSQPAGGEIVPRGRALPRFDVHCAFMSLPRVLGATLDTLRERRVPYLGADPAAVERWARRLAGTGSGLKVGLAWAGNPKHSADRRRSLAIERLAGLVEIKGASFYSLQVGERAQDLALLPQGHVIDLAPELKDFSETAAAVANLDLVVSVDTSLVHLCGAIGRPCWVMLAFSPDWRWLTERRDSPWYPSLRLFRQDAPGAWDGVLGRIAEALTAEIAARRPAGPPLDAGVLLSEALARHQALDKAEAERL